MHELAFADAARPTPVVILRLLLRPYSLGHELLLLRQRNPFLTLSPAQFSAQPEVDQRQALIRAVLICCNTWSENQRPHRWLWLWRWFNRGANWPLSIAEFRNYLTEAHAEMPGPDDEADEIVSKVNGYTPLKEMRGRQFGAPAIARLINFVLFHHLVTLVEVESSVWDFPYALANHLYATHLESEGCLRIENFPETEEKMEFAKIRSDVAAEQAAAKAAEDPAAKPTSDTECQP